MIKIDKFLVTSTELFISSFFMYGIALSFFKKLNSKFTEIILHSSVSLGFIAGFIKFIIYINNQRKVNVLFIKITRYIIVIIGFLAILTLIFCFIKILIKKLDSKFFNNLIAFMFALTLFFTFFYITPIAYQMTGEFVYFGEDTMSTMALLRATGFFTGLILCLVSSAVIVKTSKYIKKSIMFMFLTLSIIIFAINYGAKAVAALSRLKLINSKGIIFKIMIFEDAHSKNLIYALLLTGFIMLLYVYFKNLRIKNIYKNNAQFRKAKAIARTGRRYSLSLFSCLLSVFLIMTMVYYYATKEVELTPPQSYTMEDNKIIIPYSDVNDGHLHRFSYKTPSGLDVRFIVVQKLNGVSYGVGLDACEICGIAGYFERGDNVVCKRCDVVMNKNTIGFKGGCNPIPFPYVVKSQKIIIDVEELIREENRFR